MTDDIKVDLKADGSQAAEQISALDRRVDELTKSFRQQSREADRGAKLATGSYAKLERELKDNVKKLKQMEIGSKAFTAQKRKVDALAASLAKAKGQVSTTSAGAGMFNRMATTGLAKLGGLAAGMASLQTAVSLVVSELDKAKTVEVKAAEQERIFEDALADIALNIGGGQLGEARELIAEVSRNLGTSQGDFANLIGVAISAGAKDLKEAVQVAGTAVQATGGNTQAAAEFTQTALDIASLSGSTNFRGALGQVAQTQSQVRSVNASEFFSNIGPALAAVTADRANIDAITTERGLEISSVVSQILKDRTGANTATAVRQFVTRLDSFVPELKTTLKDGSKATLTKEQIEQFRETRSIDERIDLFRNNEALSRQFLDKQKEGIGKGAIAELIQGTDRALKIEEKASAGIGSLDEAEVSFKELVEGIKDATVVSRIDRLSQANIQFTQTQTGTEKFAGQARKIIDDTREAANRFGFDTLTNKLDTIGGELAVASGEDRLQTLVIQMASLVQSAKKTETKADDELALRQLRLAEQLLASSKRLEEKQKPTQPQAGPRPIAPAAAGAL